MTRFAIIALAVTVVGACGKKDDAGSGGKAADKGGDKGKGTSVGTIDAAACNAAVPAALKDKIVFEKRDIVIEQGRDKTTYTLAAPKGWSLESKMFAHLRPDKDGFATKLNLGADCDGECKPKEWEKIADKNFFAKRAAAGKVAKDEKKPGQRLMIADMDQSGMKTTDVVFAWWTEGAKSYHTCVAELDESIKDAAPAFEKACQAITIVGED
jgi:hypothetical protein